MPRLNNRSSQSVMFCVHTHIHTPDWLLVSSAAARAFSSVLMKGLSLRCSADVAAPYSGCRTVTNYQSFTSHPVIHQLLTSYSAIIHQLLTSYSPVIHQLFTNDPQVIHQLFTSDPRVIHQLLTSCPPFTYQQSTSFSPVTLLIRWRSPDEPTAG